MRSVRDSKNLCEGYREHRKLDPSGVGGGAPGAPPIYLGSGANFGPKIMFP